MQDSNIFLEAANFRPVFYGEFQPSVDLAQNFIAAINRAIDMPELAASRPEQASMSIQLATILQIEPFGGTPHATPSGVMIPLIELHGRDPDWLGTAQNDSYRSSVYLDIGRDDNGAMRTRLCRHSFGRGAHPAEHSRNLNLQDLRDRRDLQQALGMLWHDIAGGTGAAMDETMLSFAFSGEHHTRPMLDGLMADLAASCEMPLPPPGRRRKATGAQATA